MHMYLYSYICIKCMHIFIHNITYTYMQQLVMKTGNLKDIKERCLGRFGKKKVKGGMI